MLARYNTMNPDLSSLPLQDNAGVETMLVWGIPMLAMYVEQCWWFEGLSVSRLRIDLFETGNWFVFELV